MSKDIQLKKPTSEPDLNMLGGMPGMDRFVDRLFSDPFAPFFTPATSPYLSNLTMPAQPRTDVRETNDAYVLSAEVPGIPKDKIEVEVNGNILSIRAECRTASEDSEDASRSFQSFQQSFSLPTTIDAENIEAQCEDGVLEVLIPKKVSAQSKKIAVHSGKGSILSRLAEKKSQKSTSKNVN
jgi:HSP20 family protein